MTSSRFIFSQQIGYTALLLMLVSSPETAPKVVRMCKVSWTSSLAGFKKMAASSAYKLSLSLADLLVIGESAPSLVAKSNSRWSGSIARMNSIGDKGSPCRSPVLCLNHCPRPPFSRTEVEADERSVETHALHFCPKPNLERVSIR